MGEPTSTGGNAGGGFIEYQYETVNPIVGTGDDTLKLCRFMFDAKDKFKD